MVAIAVGAVGGPGAGDEPEIGTDQGNQTGHDRLGDGGEDQDMGQQSQAPAAAHQRQGQREHQRQAQAAEPVRHGCMQVQRQRHPADGPFRHIVVLGGQGG